MPNRRRHAGVLAVCFLIAVTLGVFAGADLLHVALPMLPLFVLAWLAMGGSDRQAQRVEEPPSEPQPQVSRRGDPALDRIAALADVGVIQMSRDGTLEFASRRARQFLGFEDEAAALERWPAIAETIKRHSDPNATAAGVFEVEATSGPLALSFKVHPIYDEDWSGYLVQIRDPRALAALESDLRSAAKQRGLNQVCVGIAHDVRGALNAAILNLRSLEAEAQDKGLDSSVRERVDVVRSELDRLHRSLEMLLRETAPEQSVRQDVELDEVARAVAALIEIKARGQGVAIDCVREADACVAARPDRIRETVLILAINALEAMPGGGTLRFVTGTTNGCPRLDVVDSGCGISADILPRIFELHYTTKPLGTGVGLWAARSIVESENGRLDVIATGPAGTTFRMTFLPGREN
jgi:signal transduction histidine kinase